MFPLLISFLPFSSLLPFPARRRIETGKEKRKEKGKKKKIENVGKGGGFNVHPLISPTFLPFLVLLLEKFAPVRKIGLVELFFDRIQVVRRGIW